MNIQRFDLDRDDRISEYHRDGDFVLAEDYNALAARLAEAERLLDQAADLILGCVEARSPPDLTNDIDAFLGVSRASDNAPERSA